MMCLFAMMAASLSAKAQEITITLRPGWNWIGYPNAITMELSDAFGDFMPMEGDVVKSEFAFAEYLNGNWAGSLTHFMPGKGYMYCSRRTEETSFVFRGSTSQSQVFVTTAEPTTITATSAVSGGSVTSNDGSFVLMKGVCWATHPNPIANDDYHTENGSGAGMFTVSMTGLTSNTTYYVRAYAVSLSGLTYGEQFVFTTTQTQNYIIEVAANPSNGGTVSCGGTYQQGQSCTVTASANSDFEFTNWTENGSVVSNNASYSFTVTGNRSLVANFQSSAPAGSINGLFSVCAGRLVYFSKGNLQHQASTNCWRFAEHQWDYIGGIEGSTGVFNGNVGGSSNNEISATYSGWIDLFCWGTSGYNHGAVCYQPWSTSDNNSDYYAYGSVGYNLFDQTGQADWGYNSISNGGSQENCGWRVLTKDEWVYVFNTRETSSGIRFAKGRVNGVNGVILLPDSWDSSTYALNYTNNENAAYTSNIIPSNDWSNILEVNGAVFLPSSGKRFFGFGEHGFYWSSSRKDYNSAYILHFHAEFYLDPDSYNYRSEGHAVRLVQNYQP